jgi:hypothetical protein
MLREITVSMGTSTSCGAPTAPTTEPGRAIANGVAAEGDDSGRAETPGRDDCAQTHRTVADDGDGIAVLHGRADGGMMAGAHHVRKREQGAQGVVRMAFAGNADERAAGEWYADRLTLATVDAVVAKRSTSDAVRRPSRATVRAGAIAVGERRNDQVSGADTSHR